jgi:hypothetical protein
VGVLLRAWAAPHAPRTDCESPWEPTLRVSGGIRFVFRTVLALSASFAYAARLTWSGMQDLREATFCSRHTYPWLPSTKGEHSPEVQLARSVLGLTKRYILALGRRLPLLVVHRIWHRLGISDLDKRIGIAL